MLSSRLGWHLSHTAALYLTIKYVLEGAKSNCIIDLPVWNMVISTNGWVLPGMHVLGLQ